jgi:hypothetical protein
MNFENVASSKVLENLNPTLIMIGIGLEYDFTNFRLCQLIKTIETYSYGNDL